MRKKYSTVNKKKIIDYIKRTTNNFSAQDLFHIIKDSGDEVGLTTVYRTLEELTTNGIITKSYSNNIAQYQYLEKCDKMNHFFLKCSNCEKLIHIDCDCITNLNNHILKNHNFYMDNMNVIITGLCKKCMEVTTNE